MSSSWRWLLTTLHNYWLVLVACVAAGYRADYHFPQADAHPDWPVFPQLYTQHLMVEPITDIDSLYGRRLHLRHNYEGDLLEVDSPQVSAVRVRGHRVRRNTFQFWEPNNTTSSGRYIGPVETQGFNQYRDQYLEVDVAGEKGYFKVDYASFVPALDNIHQYNLPTDRQDTLFLRVDSKDYRIFIR
ncbi:hypothetical protein [Hymenobacter cheonanensis]|uniref:hypothetical protein n=1 Tax=Hymenobacter sp. CA2-7 TaxID=3063993 RepID=UPI0027136B0D|nr:hypothetical protein [Hymenobacter sp. CA2-7]MDO7888215.1 hypothetical protein [Hymenobacter sp. CA2-7]